MSRTIVTMQMVAAQMKHGGTPGGVFRATAPLSGSSVDEEMVRRAVSQDENRNRVERLDE